MKSLASIDVIAVLHSGSKYQPLNTKPVSVETGLIKVICSVFPINNGLLKEIVPSS